MKKATPQQLVNRFISFALYCAAIGMTIGAILSILGYID